jgi:uncharacterized protein (TIGR00730 family)
MKSICVYCGANPGTLPIYRESAMRLGQLLAKARVQIVYGGGNVGLMGIIADAALAEGGHVLGVIPESLEKLEVAHRGLTELRIGRSMHERKLMMAEHSQAFIALPGGIGTAEEIFEMFTWSQLGIHLKPCGILNVGGFYDGFIQRIQRMVTDGFLRAEQAEQLIIDDDIERLLKRLMTSQPRVLQKWTEREKVVL